MDNQIEIPSSIIINKCSTELKNEILKYAGENSIKIDKLCLMMDGIMADLHRMRADYYAQTMADMFKSKLCFAYSSQEKKSFYHYQSPIH